MAKAKFVELNDKLFEIFAGDYINVVMDFTVESITQSEREVEQMKTPLIAEGWLTDQDDNYLFLGIMPESYSQALRKNAIILVEAKAPPEEEVEKKSSIPTTDKGLN
jgi:hypothetical protein